jgi:hypothetical protein
VASEAGDRGRSTAGTGVIFHGKTIPSFAETAIKGAKPIRIVR